MLTISIMGNKRGDVNETVDGWVRSGLSPNLKNDQYRKARGGKAILLSIFCRKCGCLLLVYQKDGFGPLRRCYLNRIFAPTILEALQHDSSLTSPNQLHVLRCRCCNTVIGFPMLHHDGRLAYRLDPGAFSKRRGIRTNPE